MYTIEIKNNLGVTRHSNFSKLGLKTFEDVLSESLENNSSMFLAEGDGYIIIPAEMLKSSIITIYKQSND